VPYSLKAVNEIIPFLSVTDMKKSLGFYVDGLGFAIEKRWEVDGEIRWCQLRLGRAAIMLQQFPTEGHDSRQLSEHRGEGVTLCLFPNDAVAFYRTIEPRGLNPSEPVVSNSLWGFELTDPDGYKLLIESPTGTPESTKLSERG
jgi:uncharacterized glyoxalase superfamily protein PhnB